MKQYLHTIMRSLCIMLMLCGISNGAWAQEEETPACQWAIALGIISSPEDYTEDMGTDSNPLVINDGYWDFFVQYVTATDETAISTEGLYFQLGAELTIDGGSDEGWTPISGFEGYFDGNNSSYTVYISNCDILSCSLFEDEVNNDNIDNIAYSGSDIIISTVDGLQELNTNASSWAEICTSYTIDLTEGDIEIDGDNWSAITESFTLNYTTDSDNPHYVIFKFTEGYSAYDMSSSAINLLSSDTYVDSNCKYNYLTVSCASDFEAWAGNSDLVAATMKLQLTGDIDYSNTDPSSFPSCFPLTYTGEFDQNGQSILYPAPRISDDATPLLFDPEYVQGEVVYSPQGALLINDATDFETFANNQDYWYGVSGGSIEISESFTLSNFYTPIQERFTVTGANYITVGESSNQLDIEDYQPVFEKEDDNSNVIYNMCINSALGFEKLTSTSFDSSSYIYLNPDCKEVDLTGITIGSSTSNSLTIDEDVKFYLPDFCSNVPFTPSGSGNLTKYYSPSCYMVDILYKGALFDSSMRGDNYSDMNDYEFVELLEDAAGHGTEDSPYLIYSYGMLEKLKEIIETAEESDADYTSGMYIQLASDINVQGNERLTDINGQKIIDSPIENVQFTNAFKGHFDGDKHSIGGLTQPLFSSLDGATIENLGIVDCNMTTPALVAGTASGSTVTMSYVSGVSNGLVPADGITATNCYAFNPQTYANRTNKTVKWATTDADGYKAYNISEGTGDGKVTLVDDLSGTHKVIKGNSYSIAGGYSDCTLFIPTSNTFYTYSPSSTLDMGTYISYIKWEDNFDWIESPCKSNVTLLHNVLCNDFWSKNTCNDGFGGYGGKTELPHLYSWYIVDKANFTVPSDPFRVKNIYYSRNNTSTTSPAPDGLNTIYLPFAWNPATDLYYTNNGVETQITDATVHILADKLTETDGEYSFSDEALYKDYSMEKSLLFFQPTNADFAKVSNALPTLLNIPEGKSGWYIKRTELANYGIEITDDKTETINGKNFTYPNLYDRYWEAPDAINNPSYDESQQKKGRSFMEIDRLGVEWSEGGHDTSYDSYTRTIHYTCEDSSSPIYNCGNPVKISKTDEDKTVAINSNTEDYQIYKANEDGDIAVKGDDMLLQIIQAEAIIAGDNRPLTIYQVDESGNIVQDEDNCDISIQTSENDQIHLDNEGYPVKIILEDGNVEIDLTRENEQITGEVVSGSGILHDNVIVEYDSNSYPYIYETSSSDRIVVDNEGYPKMIILNYSSDPVEIEINRDGGSITGKVISGDEGTLKEGDKVVIDDFNNYYPLSFYVCGGHEEPEDCTWDGSDFPGRAYHLGTFSGITAGTFADGKYNDYSCYKLNSAGDGFAKVTSGSTVQPFRTFFAIAPAPDTNASTSAKAYTLGFCGIYDGTDIEDTPTQIDGAPVEGIKLITTAQSRVYSLDGRYVGQYGQKKLARGMYIMNGRKFVVK